MKHVVFHLQDMSPAGIPERVRPTSPTLFSSEVLIQLTRSLVMAHQLRLVAITQLEPVKTHRVMPARVQHGERDGVGTLKQREEHTSTLQDYENNKSYQEL